MPKQTREELIAEMTATMKTAKELGMEDMVVYYEKEIKLVSEISEEHLIAYQSGCVRHTGESELYRIYQTNFLRGLEERFNHAMTLSLGLIKPQSKPDVDTTTIDNGFSRVAISSAVNYLDRGNMIGQLKMWETQATSLKLVAQTLIFSKEIDRLKSMSDAEYDGSEERINSNVIKAVIYLSEVHTQNVLAVRRGTMAPMRAGCRNNKYHDQPLNEQKVERLRSPLDCLHDPEHIYYGGKLGPDIDPITPYDELNCGDYKFKPNVVQDALSKSLHDDLPTDTYGNSPDIQIHHRFERLPPSYYSSKHHPSIVEDQYKTKAFTNVIPADHAQRMINDLNHLITITTDVEYAASLSEEVQRLQYIADGRITKASDVNYAWIMVPGLYDRKELHLKDEGLDLYGKPDDLEETDKDS